jgi:hypothetical protein
LTQPSRVRLAFENTPLTEVARSLTLQTGFKVTLDPENLPKWHYQRVTLRESDPVPFWKAVDQLCDSAQLQYNPGMHGFAPQREPVFTLTEGSIRTITPTSDHGPFRVSLLGLKYQRDVSYLGVGAGFRPVRGNPPGGRPRPAVPLRPNPVTTAEFTASLQVAAEPRLSLSQNGPLQILEAVDNRGNSLTVAAEDGMVFHRTAGYFGVMNSSVMQLQAQLQRPASAGESIKKLRGVIPVAVSSRRPDPLVISLSQAVGKRYENPDVELTLHDIRTVPNTQQTLIELSVRPKEGGAAAHRGDDDVFNDVMHRSATQRLQLELFDSRGQAVPWFPSGLDSETSHVTLTIANLPHTAALKELRYYTLTRATVKVPFEFSEIPMP